MTVPGAVRSSDSVLDALTRMTDGFFRDPATGQVTMYARPNAKIKLVGALMGASRGLRAVRVVDAGDHLDALLERAAMAALVWWSVDQVMHGTTKYLKTIGGVTLAGAVMRTVIAERARYLSRP